MIKYQKFVLSKLFYLWFESWLPLAEAPDDLKDTRVWLWELRWELKVAQQDQGLIDMDIYWSQNPHVVELDYIVSDDIITREIQEAIESWRTIYLEIKYNRLMFKLRIPKNINADKELVLQGLRRIKDRLENIFLSGDERWNNIIKQESRRIDLYSDGEVGFYF